MNSKSLQDWLAVILVDWSQEEDGIWTVLNDRTGDVIAIFYHEVDAYRFRLDYINRKLNP